MDKQNKLFNKILDEMISNTYVDFCVSQQVKLAGKMGVVTLYNDEFTLNGSVIKGFEKYVSVYGFTNTEKRYLLNRYCGYIRKEIKRQIGFDYNQN